MIVIRGGFEIQENGHKKAQRAQKSCTSDKSLSLVFKGCSCFVIFVPFCGHFKTRSKKTA
jgi:hypothetical protein